MLYVGPIKRGSLDVGGDNDDDVDGDGDGDGDGDDDEDGAES